MDVNRTASTANSPTDAVAKPNRFLAAIGGSTGRSFSVELSADELGYIEYGPGYRSLRATRIAPTPMQWREFREALESIDVWKWKGNYPARLAVSDGTHWTFEVAYDDTQVFTGGDNAYPEDDADDEGAMLSVAPSAPFERFLKAVSKLINGREFV